MDNALPYERITDDQYVKNRVRIEWVDLGEGWDGDYDETDPEDQPLLRFDVSYLVRAGEKYPYGTDQGLWECEPAEEDEWVEMRDASYCTQFPATATSEQKQAALRLLMDRIYDEAKDGDCIKKTCEDLSWISLEWLEKK